MLQLGVQQCGSVSSVFRLVLAVLNCNIFINGMNHIDRCNIAVSLMLICKMALTECAIAQGKPHEKGHDQTPTLLQKMLLYTLVWKSTASNHPG